MQEKIGVVVLNYNSSLDTKKCLSFLLKQEDIELDIIVVDNCSLPEERTKLEVILNEYKEHCAPHLITYIPNKENRGYNAGNNIGLRYAAKQRYKFTVISNPDMEFPNVCYFYKLMEKMKQDISIGVICSDIINNDGMHQNPMREIAYCEELLWPIEYLKNMLHERWYSLDYSSSCYCEKMSGCCLMLRMSFIEGIGYFDENVFLYSEESILGAQVRMSGYKMYYCHDVQAIHRHIEKSKGNPKPRMKALFKSRDYYLKTYSGYAYFPLWLLRRSKQIQQICAIGL